MQVLFGGRLTKVTHKSPLALVCLAAELVLLLLYKQADLGLTFDCPSRLQAMINVQMLSELEEVIQYKLVPERREAIRQMWWDRLQVCVCVSV